MLETAKSGESVVRILSDETDMFVLLVYWVNWADWQCANWEGPLLGINGTCADLGQKCLQLLGMRALSGYVTTSYPYGKGSVIALNTMVSGNFQGLATIDDVGTIHTELVNAAMLSLLY